MLQISFISKPIMCKFYFVSLISGTQRSQVSQDSVCCIVLRVHFEALKPLLLLTDIRRQRWPETQTFTVAWKDFPVLHPFNLCKCKMYHVKRAGRFHVVMHQRFEDIFFLKGICDINSHILSLWCYKSKKLRRKSGIMLLKQQHKPQSNVRSCLSAVLNLWVANNLRSNDPLT